MDSTLKIYEKFADWPIGRVLGFTTIYETNEYGYFGSVVHHYCKMFYSSEKCKGLYGYKNHTNSNSYSILY